MLPTPSTSHVDYDRIYEPAEDSYLVLDTLSSQDEIKFLTSHFSAGPAPLLCEIGTGSGVVLAFLTSNAPTILGRSDVLSFGTDLNPFACAATALTVRNALLQISCPAELLATMNADLASPLRASQVDILVFNPPYVPAPLPEMRGQLDTASAQAQFEMDSHLLALSYAGGQDGMEVTNRLLRELPRVLSARGMAYVLLCAQNRPEAVRTKIEGWEGGWKAEIVGRSGMKAGWEKLVVLRIWRPSSPNLV